MSFSYIICYRHQPDRYKNLLKTVNYLRANFDLELILVEQDNESKIPNKSLFDKYLFSYTERPFNRSWAFNVGAKYAKTDKLFFGDCDLICPKQQMDICVEKLNTIGCVSPYDHVVDLTQQESVLVNPKYWGKINRPSRGGINLTGGIIGFRKEDFYKVAGWCEDFEGWGGEDDFQTWKVKNWITWEEVKGYVYHLWHTRPNIVQTVYQNNLNILHSISKNNSQDVVNWINNSRQLIGRIDKYRDEAYYNYLKGKTVCLVGPASHMLGSKYGEKIEAYDIVVRLNRALPVPENRIEDLGKRTDIFYNCLNPEPDSGGVLDFQLISDNVKFLSMPYPEIFPFDRDVIRFNAQNENWNIPFHIMNLEKFAAVSNEMKTRPNTGTLAMIDLLSFPIKELYVTGFSFFRGGYDLSYRDNIEGVKVIDQNHSEELVMNRMKSAGNHSQEEQIEYIKKLFKSDSRFKGDDVFQKIMNEK